MSRMWFMIYSYLWRRLSVIYLKDMFRYRDLHNTFLHNGLSSPAAYVSLEVASGRVLLFPVFWVYLPFRFQGGCISSFATPEMFSCSLLTFTILPKSKNVINDFKFGQSTGTNLGWYEWCSFTTYKSCLMKHVLFSTICIYTGIPIIFAYILR